ncbi:helix-turn-helix domain-containing protein [Sporosarcina soli]|uniref:Helix-turn-helix domain-containing protein n=1 Tax=Sporosarcina soli TaxID=334736 RepID=A0ABW0TFR5_9BACL
MDLSTILLTIVNKMDGERTIYAGYHLLRGKRSGQTLQDVEYYGVKSFFGILPKLSMEQFEEAVRQLEQAGYLAKNEDALAFVTEKGRIRVDQCPSCQFNGWDYRGREWMFFERLSLIVQTVSNIGAGERSFMPIQKEQAIQDFVKALLVKQPISEPQFAQSIANELKRSIVQSGMDELQKTILTHRLSGFRMTGWTWDQLADQLKRNSFDIRLLFIESLHRLLTVIHKSDDFPFLRKVAADVKVTSYLTDSSVKTKQLFERGMSLEEIAEARNLKCSTIEDHFVEMSINDPQFPLTQFVSEEHAADVIAKVNELGTRRLRILKSEFSTLSYFQLRLILGARTGGNR